MTIRHETMGVCISALAVPCGGLCVFRRMQGRGILFVFAQRSMTVVWVVFLDYNAVGALVRLGVVIMHAIDRWLGIEMCVMILVYRTEGGWECAHRSQGASSLPGYPSPQQGYHSRRQCCMRAHEPPAGFQ